MADKINIVVCNCNNGENLKRCINSIKANTEDYKLIVVDQNSKDGSKEWLQENVGHLILDKKRLGRADGRNKGLKVCKSEFIAIVDADIEIKQKDWIEYLWNHMTDRRVGFVEAEIHAICHGDSIARTFAGIACCLIRRTCLDEIGFFDASIAHGSEYDWLARLEWSDWWMEYANGTNIVSHTGRGLAGCLEWNIDIVKTDLLKNLGFKYTMNFMEQTIIKNIQRRQTMVECLIGGKNGFNSRIANGQCPMSDTATK